MTGSPAWEVTEQGFELDGPRLCNSTFFFFFFLVMEEGGLYLYLAFAAPRVWYLWYSCGPLEWRLL